VTEPTKEEIQAAIAAIREREMKIALRSALKEWLDEQFILVGRWSARGFTAAGLAAIVYFILWKTGNSTGWGK
jgi:hypothetical protein